MSDIVNKLWGFCHVLRHDGIDYGDYIEQLTYLLFLKMAEERGAEIPKECNWASLKDKSGTALTDHYADILRRLRGGSFDAGCSTYGRDCGHPVLLTAGTRVLRVRTYSEMSAGRRRATALERGSL